MIEINGKQYPLWSQLVERKHEWIGGILEDFGDSMDKAMFGDEEVHNTTKIKDITLKPNGKDSAMFFVEGEDFSCGFDCGHGGIATGEKGWLTFSGYMEHEWRIKEPNKETKEATP